MQWMDFDRLLVQLWESHAIRTNVVYIAAREQEVVDKYIGDPLPEITGRGITEGWLTESTQLHVPW